MNSDVKYTGAPPVMHLNTKNSKLKVKLLLNWEPAQANNKGVMWSNFPAPLTNLLPKILYCLEFVQIRFIWRGSTTEEQ